MVSCGQRDAVRAATLASWKNADCRAEVAVELDVSQALAHERRIEETWLRGLRAALGTQADFTLMLEDDLEFNRHLWHNLERWAPLLAASQTERPGARPFFGSLYRANQALLWTNPDERYAVGAPESFWGAQALVLSRATAQRLLDRWVEGGRAHDLKMPLLAAEVGPVYFHLPSLVQHRPGPSTWGNRQHRAADFDAEYKAP
jgi:hypothetical protein